MVTAKQYLLIEEVVQQYPRTKEGFHSTINHLKLLLNDEDDWGDEHVDAVIYIGQYGYLFER